MEEGVIPGANLSPYPSGGKGTVIREVWCNRAVAASARSVTKSVTKPERPIKVAPGVIHVEAEDFFNEGGLGGFGYKGATVIDCHTGGKQVYFGALMQTAWVGYRIDVPKTGIYELTARVALVNWGQRLYVRSFGAMYPVKSAKASDVFGGQVKNLGPQLANSLLQDHPQATAIGAVLAGVAGVAVVVRLVFARVHRVTRRQLLRELTKETVQPWMLN